MAGKENKGPETEAVNQASGPRKAMLYVESQEARKSFSLGSVSEAIGQNEGQGVQQARKRGTMGTVEASGSVKEPLWRQRLLGLKEDQEGQRRN